MTGIFYFFFFFISSWTVFFKKKSSISPLFIILLFDNRTLNLFCSARTLKRRFCRLHATNLVSAARLWRRHCHVQPFKIKVLEQAVGKLFWFCFVFWLKQAGSFFKILYFLSYLFIKTHLFFNSPIFYLHGPSAYGYQSTFNLQTWCRKVKAQPILLVLQSLNNKSLRPTRQTPKVRPMG